MSKTNDNPVHSPPPKCPQYSSLLCSTLFFITPPHFILNICTDLTESREKPLRTILISTEKEEPGTKVICSMKTSARNYPQNATDSKAAETPSHFNKGFIQQGLNDDLKVGKRTSCVITQIQTLKGVNPTTNCHDAEIMSVHNDNGEKERKNT